MQKTGGEICPAVNVTDIDEAIKNIIGTQIDGLKNIYDSDSVLQVNSDTCTAVIENHVVIEDLGVIENENEPCSASQEVIEYSKTDDQASELVLITKCLYSVQDYFNWSNTNH